MKYLIIRIIYKYFVKQILFLFPPDYVHDLITFKGKILGSNIITRKMVSTIFRYKNSKLLSSIVGVTFDNPVGLSAGFDKDGKLTQILPSIGFGFTQIGTVTKSEYRGNPRPWAYRLKKSKSILVNYGLKNEGITSILKHLKSKKFEIPVSLSVGKTNSSASATEEGGIQEYVECIKIAEKSNIPFSFYTLNVSCPNAFGGEAFTTPSSLDHLLKAIIQLNVSKPIFIKMPINLTWEDFSKLLDVVIKYKIAGVIIGNLQKDRTHSSIKDSLSDSQKGNLSGKPTWELSNELIRKTYNYCGKNLKIIGVGGIFSAEDAYQKIKYGASLVQLITGMIYEGPQLIGEINKKIATYLTRDGYSSISEAVGVESTN